MKSEPKPFASLSSGLLARKGAARPAMRPQSFGQLGAGLEDLGWNDMGFEPPRASAAPVEAASGEPQVVHEHPVLNGHAGLTPIQSPVHGQQAEIAGRLTAASAEAPDAPASEFAPIEAPSIEAAVEPAPRMAAVEPAPVEPTAEELVAAPAPHQVEQRVAAVRQAHERAQPAGKKAAFTLRLDPERHLKLRLACAVGGRSAQQLVTEALDRMLAAIPELDRLSARAHRKG